MDDATRNVPSEAADEAVMTMDELMAQYEAAEPLQELREGDVVTGTIVQIDETCAMVDVGTKSEGMIPKNELDLIRDQIQVGDKVQVAVKRIEDEDGNLIVSKRQADHERAWEAIVDKEHDGEILEAMVVEAVKGGLLVDLGIYGQGFVPASHVSVRRPRNLQRYVGQTLRLQIIEVERKRKRVVLSHRKVLEDERAYERDETLSNLGEGQVRRGVVRRITDFGAFVDIGGVDGLLHISEMSWNRINDPGEMLKVNDELEVMVLKLNLSEGRISLGLRQLQQDPWRDIPKIYREGQIIRARVNQVLEDGLVVRMPVGVDAFVAVDPAELLAPAEEAVTAEAEAETPAEPVAEATTEATAEASSEATAPADGAESAPAEAEAAEATPAEATEAAATEAESDELPGRYSIGAEVEVRIERLVPVEREIQLSLASDKPLIDRRESVESSPVRTSRYDDSAPRERGRFSDRAQQRDDDDRGEGRMQTSSRRERRSREPERDERPQIMPDKQAAPATTLGDLMGDKLRALFGGGQTESDAASDTEDSSETAEESTEDSTK